MTLVDPYALLIKDLPLSNRARNALFDITERVLYPREENTSTVGEVYERLRLAYNGQGRVVRSVQRVGDLTACEIRAVLLDANVPRWMVDSIAPALDNNITNTKRRTT